MEIDVLNGVFFLSLKVMVLAGITVLLLSRSRNTSSANLHKVAVLSLASVFLMPVIMVALPSIPLAIAPESWSESLQWPLLYSPVRWVFLAYLLITSVFVSHLIYELILLKRLRSARVSAFPVNALNMALDIQQKLGLRRRVTFICSQKVRSPISWGCVNPHVAMPLESLLWREDRFRRVLIHELAHIKRNDWSTKILAHLVVAVFWFIPGVWALKRKIDWFAELACDDWVLNLEDEGLGYANDLLSLSSSGGMPHTHGIPHTHSMANALTGSDNIYSRIGAVLDSSRVRFYTAFETTFFCVTGFLLVVFFAMLKIETYQQHSPLPAVFFHNLALAEKQKIEKQLADELKDGTEAALITEKNPEAQTDTWFAEDEQFLQSNKVARELAESAFSSARVPIRPAEFTPALQTAEQIPVAFQDLREFSAPPKKVDYMLLHSVRPEYPKKALQRGVEADVTVTFDISSSGLVQNMRVQSSSEIEAFEQAAITALEQYYFQPRFEDGRPVASKNIREHFQFRIIEGAN